MEIGDVVVVRPVVYVMNIWSVMFVLLPPI